MRARSGRDRSAHGGSWVKTRIVVLVAISTAVLLGAFALAGVSPATAIQTIADSAFGSDRNVGRTLRETAPLLLAGLAVYVALKAGLFNIGVEGQLTVGALGCAAVSLAIAGPAGLILGALAGAICGGLWALPAGLIRAYKGGHEVISTIMLNNVAMGLSLALLAGPMKAPGQEGTTTPNLDPSTWIPNAIRIGRLEVNLAIPLILLAIVGFSYWLKRSVGGYELRLVGDNARAAEFAGVDSKRVWVKSMFVSGALGGLTGAMLVLAYEHRCYGSISSGYGFDALGVALLAGKTPLAIIPAALAFGALNKGASSLQLLGIPKGMTYVVLAILIICFAALRYRRQPVEAT